MNKILLERTVCFKALVKNSNKYINSTIFSRLNSTQVQSHQVNYFIYYLKETLNKFEYIIKDEASGRSNLKNFVEACKHPELLIDDKNYSQEFRSKIKSVVSEINSSSE